jgi:hypothetical protein
VVDDADHEEQRRLEQRVRQQHHGAGQRRVPEPGTQRHCQQSELAHRAVGEQQFQVMLAQRRPAAEEQRQRAGHQHERTPRHGIGEHRAGQGHQVHAGLDHRGGVQVRADRGRGSHRRGQPEAEREDRRLTQRTQQHQDHGGRQVSALRRRLGHLRPPVAAGVLTQHDDADQHGQPAHGGDDQRLQRGPARRPAGRIVPDQQVREDGGQFPEDVQHDEVVRDHQTEHRAGESDEDAGEPSQPGLGGIEVSGAVGQCQRAHPPTSSTMSQDSAVIRRARVSPRCATHGCSSATAPPARTAPVWVSAHPAPAAGTMASR